MSTASTTASASCVTATSCTRNKCAPRIRAATQAAYCYVHDGGSLPVGAAGAFKGMKAEFELQ